VTGPVRGPNRSQSSATRLRHTLYVLLGAVAAVLLIGAPPGQSDHGPRPPREKGSRHKGVAGAGRWRRFAQFLTERSSGCQLRAARGATAAGIAMVVGPAGHYAAFALPSEANFGSTMRVLFCSRCVFRVGRGSGSTCPPAGGDPICESMKEGVRGTQRRKLYVCAQAGAAKRAW